MLERIVDGRIDLVFEYLAQGHAADAADENGVPLIGWCAYYGDVAAIRHLLACGDRWRRSATTSASTARRSTAIGACANS